jgi:hypothetical protein
MKAEILHAGFDGLKFTLQADIPPAFRAKLVDAKAHAVKTNRDCVLETGGISLAVRRSGGSAFSAHTGEYGAEWYFLDPENRPPSNPGITVDFRAFLLATGGLAAAQAYFETHMAAFGVEYVETQLRVSRVDFAIDILAPWFEPDREALVSPPGTHADEYTGICETETHSTGARVTGLRAGAVSNRQLAIYDKRAEIIAKGKTGWLEIWNLNRALVNNPPLDLEDPNQSRVWRFELRLGSKQLRGKWLIKNWADLNAKIGDAFANFTDSIRYTIPQNDSNRSRWPVHELWQAVTKTVAQELSTMRSGAEPATVKTANREAHKRMLDGLILGLMVSRAAAERADIENFDSFLQRQSRHLRRLSKAHPVPIGERLAKAKGRYLFR